VANGVGDGIPPQAPVQVRGFEQLRVILGQPGQQRRPGNTEAGLHVQGPDDRDELQVRRSRAGELEVDQRAGVAVADQDIAQVEVRVQQDVAVGVRRQLPEFR
jgi:hypothetical protein